MDFTRTRFLKYVKMAVVVGIIAVIVGYGIWRSLNYARGPVIEITEPAHGAAIVADTVIIKGTGIRVNKLSINGDSVSIDEQGNFSQTIVVFPGVNIITLVGYDQFERSTERELRVVGLRK